MEKALQYIQDYSARGASLREEFFQNYSLIIKDAALKIAVCIAKGSKLLICGNGGSAADAQHVAGEFVNRFLLDRPALPAIALTTDSSTITAIANDFDFASIFSRQVEALGNPGDVLLAISTSGNSANVVEAIKIAMHKEIYTIGLTGKGGGKIAGLCDLLIDVPSNETPLIQEVHLAVEHLLCYLTDYFLFENAGLLAPYLDNNFNAEEI